MIIHTQICHKPLCKKSFRARKDHELCRPCFRKEFGFSRPILSRMISENKFRRTRARKRAMKVAIQSGGKKK